MDRETITVSLDAELLAEARRRSRGNGTLSSFLNDALKQKRRAECHVECLDAPDDEFGAITAEEAETAGRWWAEMKRSGSH